MKLKAVEPIPPLKKKKITIINYGEISSKIELKNGVWVDIDNADLPLILKFSWSFSGRGAFCSPIFTDGKIHHLSMHRLIMGLPQKEIDHINGNPLDNRRSNLRTCEHYQNLSNTRKRNIKNTTSKYKGVRYRADRGIWQASICSKQKKYHLGSFCREEDAAIAYNKMALKLHGEFAVLNEVIL